MHEPKLKPNEKYEARDLTKYLTGEVTEDEFQAFKNDPLTRVSYILCMNYLSVFFRHCYILNWFTNMLIFQSYMKDYEQLMAMREMQKKKKKKVCVCIYYTVQKLGVIQRGML